MDKLKYKSQILALTPLTLSCWNSVPCQMFFETQYGFDEEYVFT